MTSACTIWVGGDAYRLTVIPRLRLPRLLRRAPVSFALQGGGAHGAFTWGVLDRLLQAGIDVGAVAGTSAGTMNALALADGWLAGRHDGARQKLADVWTANAKAFPSWMVSGPDTNPTLTSSAKTAIGVAGKLSPYQTNPFNLDPLRTLLQTHIDFERVSRASSPRLYIAATQVRTGLARFFDNKEITVDVALASACLPAVSKAVTVNGEAYWDGGYSANPGLSCLAFDPALPEDILVVLIVPRSFPGVPNTRQQIQNREAEFAFSTSFRREAQLIAESTRIAEGTMLGGRLERRLKEVRWHLIDGGGHLGRLNPQTRLIAHQPFLEYLRDQGRELADQWLQENEPQLGRNGTVTLRDLVGA